MNGYFYRVEFKPLAPYTFGTEQGLKFDGVKETGKESYIATSNSVPDQTTLLGTLRYLALKNIGLLDTSFNYSDKKDEVEKAIGKNSFRFQEEEQDFGVIKGVSPLFLWDGKCIFVKNPFCNCAGKGYYPMEMDGQFITSKGSINLPKHKDDDCPNGYDAKEGYADGYIELSEEMKIVNDDALFRKVILPGNQIVSGGKKELENAFFKREAVALKEGFSFAVFLKTSEKVFECNDNSIAYMGKTGNPFRVSFHPIDEEDAKLDEKVRDTFPGTTEVWYYALSDLFTKKLEYKQFGIVEEKHIRNLETDISGSKKEDYINRRKKKERIHLIRKGSVFYKEEPILDLNEKLKIAGYNVIVKLGGVK